MTNTNNLPTLTFHYFSAPNKMTITNDDYSSIITAELTDLQFDKDFILDAKSFDILKKLQTKRAIKITDKHIIIKSNEGEYKCTHIDKQLPNLNLTDDVYTNTYDVDVLREAIQFTSTDASKQILNGVLLNDAGVVIATDSYKLYYTGTDAGTRWFSVPREFIKLTNSGELHFTNNRVYSVGDYNVYSNLYSGNVPDLMRILNNMSGEKLRVPNNKNLLLFQADSILINVSDNKITYTSNIGENEFVVSDEVKTEINTQIKVNYNWFTKSTSIFGDELVLEFCNRMVKINNTILLCLMAL